ncbi:FapA family protein [Clostridium sp. SYSU_GA19001]|uniref:DUF342 domain-containing protein n=1 Tax=Clostridium caldaquaticum TaxID=2940653 RepID=UPI002077674D|nr:flagellar assembly protein A [Clostridium caldaquaticum]MCM8710941.1 FapA family protein [Clostridium caldaquaticum]
MKENSTLIVDKDSSIPARSLNIKITENNMEAYITITYSFKEGQNPPPSYNVDELKAELFNKGIVYGIIEENLEKCTDKNGVENILVAKGEFPVEGEDDIIHIKFDIDKDIKKLNEDKYGRIDFKNIGAVTAVSKGDVLVERVPGKDGVPGKDIKGKILKPKPVKKIKLKVSSGCEIKNENIVIASMSGKPSIKNNTFYVYKVHEVKGDVNLETGNIIFSEDILIHGHVKEGMKVIAGNTISVLKNVERAEIKGRSDIVIKGNIISSHVIGGGEDTEKLKELENLNVFRQSLKDMIGAIEEVKKFNLLGYDVSDGQIVKVLMENKFKAIPKQGLCAITHIIKSRQNDDIQGDKLLCLIKGKLLGLAPLSIKHYSEVIEIEETVNERIEFLNSTLSLPVNVKINYCQDSFINSSGDIIVSGKGSYVSELYAYNNVYFTGDMSVVRGGTVKAGKEIKCKTAGSLGGSITKLIVNEEGHIWIDKAYENIVLSIGGREFVIDYASRKLHAYLNENYELKVDRLRL